MRRCGRSSETQLTYGLCLDYGAHKDTLQDLLLFYSSTEKKLTTLKEYVGRMKEGQEAIYYGLRPHGRGNRRSAAGRPDKRSRLRDAVYDRAGG